MSRPSLSSENQYDFIAIGAGPAGESATELAGAFGHRSLIIERQTPGGTVTTTGGVPTKTLREAVLYYSGFREQNVYGLKLEVAPELALDEIRKRTWHVCETLQQATYKNIVGRGVDYLQGEASFLDGKTLRVALRDGSERIVSAKAILIATGSHPVRPIPIAFDHPGLCDSDDILKRGKPPRSLLVVGGGPVGVEFATIAHALSIPVTIVDRGPGLLSMMDGEISGRMTALMKSWEIQILNEVSLESVSLSGAWLDATLTNGQTARVDTILFAAGRAANTQGLQLENAGVKTDARGRLVVDERFRTSTPGIYAAGDVVKVTLASIAMEQARAAVCDAFSIPFEGNVDPAPVSAVYGMPEVSGAGLTEEQCRQRGLDFEVGRCDLSGTPRGAIAGRGGLLKLIFLKQDRKLVGVHCIGDIASEITGIGQMAIRCGATVNTIATMSMNTPTYSYAYKYAAFDGLKRLLEPRRELHA